MTSPEPTPAERDDVTGTAVALLRAVQTGDEAGFDAVLSSSADPRALAAYLAGLADQLGAAAYSRGQWEQECAAWRPGTRLGDSIGEVP